MPQESDFRDFDVVPPIVSPSSRHAALLHIFEDNEAVIEMVIKGRSPTIRHVSRAHRVASDWVFDRINFDLMNQVKFAETQSQLADNLTKSSLTRERWNRLLRLFCIMDENVLLRSHLTFCLTEEIEAKDAMSKRGNDSEMQNEENSRVAATSRPVRNLVLTSEQPPHCSQEISSSLISGRPASLTPRAHGSQGERGCLNLVYLKRNSPAECAPSTGGPDARRRNLLLGRSTQKLATRTASSSNRKALQNLCQKWEELAGVRQQSLPSTSGIVGHSPELLYVAISAPQQRRRSIPTRVAQRGCRNDRVSCFGGAGQDPMFAGGEAPRP